MRWSAVVWALAIAGVGAGCVSGAGDLPTRPDAGRRDAGRDAGAVEGEDAGGALADAGIDEDAGVVDEDAGAVDEDAGAMLADAGLDAGGAGDAGSDAGTSLVDAGTDAGPTSTDAGTSVPVPTIDGVVSDTEWASATVVANTIATDSSGDTLLRMRARLHSTGLYLAVEGSIAPSSFHVLTVYVDRARGTSEGRTFAELTDVNGQVDNALSPSGTPFTVPSDFRVDLAWATAVLSRSASGYDNQIGWRNFVANPGAASDFAWETANEAPSACSASACETYLPRNILDGGMGTSRPRTIALFARIADSMGAPVSNQTLPMDVPATPRAVSALLELDEP